MKKVKYVRLNFKYLLLNSQIYVKITKQNIFYAVAPSHSKSDHIKWIERKICANISITSNVYCI